MPRIFIPPMLRSLTENRDRFETNAVTVREAIADLESQFPGIESRLCVDDNLRPDIAVAIDGRVSPRGLRQKLTTDCEVHFLPAIGGG
ncbi:MoaD/ThiS family protein [Thalassoroseus pseudoceratinae]|uniref:MoaD/ThiS family protein n=1 Tax=Thalassoroseus pseudoceratinae TaxID=2713176 RepID=UPI00142386FE|nr:MoaD/ThiS family protein [Thalassoroseus pseudoceratinae]